MEMEMSIVKLGSLGFPENNERKFPSVYRLLPALSASNLL